MVYGSRFLGGPRKAMNFWNMVANKLLTLATNILYNAILSDMETCYKVFRREVVEDMQLFMRVVLNLNLNSRQKFSRKKFVFTRCRLVIMGANTMKARKSNGQMPRLHSGHC